MRLRSHDAHTQIVALSGEIDVYTAPELRQRLGETMHDGPPHLVIDLAEVRYIDSSGLSVLLEIHKRAQAERRRASIICAQPQILKLFALTGLDKILHVHATEADAIEVPPPSA